MPEKHIYLTLRDGTSVSNKERAESLLDAAQKQVEGIIATLEERQQRQETSPAEQAEITVLLERAYEMGGFLAFKQIELLMITLRDHITHLQQEAERRNTDAL